MEQTTTVAEHTFLVCRPFVILSPGVRPLALTSWAGSSLVVVPPVVFLLLAG